MTKPTARPNGSQPSLASHLPPAPEKTAKVRLGKAVAEESPYAESLLEMCGATPRLQAFTSAIDAAGLAGLLEGDGPLTIFAPTDRAFEKIPGDELAELLGDKERLADLIRHHVVTGRVKAPRATKPRSVTPQFGNELTLTASTGAFHVDEARIVKTNIRAHNGVIHAIDTVLDPG